MNKTRELKTTLKLVKDILIEKPETRNSDDLLYLAVCSRIDGISINQPFWKVILNRKNYHYPAFESVRRSRQKLQADSPDLAGDPDIEAQRELYEEVYRELARGAF